MASIFGFGDDMPTGAAPFGKYDRAPEPLGMMNLGLPQSPQQPSVTQDDVRPRIASTMPVTQQLPSVPVGPYQQQQAPSEQPYARYDAKSPSYMERLWSHKRDISKLVLLALTITIALSLHGVGKFLVKHYLSVHDLTFNQEIMLRAAYPLVVIFFVWNLKVSTSKS